MPLRTKKEEWTRQMEWNTKQAKQRKQTLNQKGVLHDQGRREQLVKEAKEYIEQSKIFKDLIRDGK